MVFYLFFRKLPSTDPSVRSCYDQNDVLVTFDDSDDIKERSSSDKKQHVQHMTDLHSKSGRLFFKDKRRLKASNFNHGLADGMGIITTDVRGNVPHLISYSTP